MNKEINIDLRRCLKAIIRKWWLVIIIGIVFYAIASLISSNSLREDEYTAEATVFSIADYSALTLYSDIITSSKVCERAANLLNISDLDADGVKQMISVKAYSLVLGIHATSTNEALAINVANAVAAVFIEEVNNITGSNSARLLDKATKVELTYDKQIEQLKFVIIVTLSGVALVCIWILFHEIFTKKIHNLSDIGLDGEIDVIGVIPLYEKKWKE